MKRLITLLLLVTLTLPVHALVLDELVTIKIYETNLPATVMIESVIERGDEKGLGRGAGVIVSPKGHVVTAYHVIEDAKYITVKLSNDSEYKAKVVSTDRKNDIALLKVELEQPSHFVYVADFLQLRVGQNLFIIGNPRGYEKSLCTGIISNINKSHFGHNYVIQTDAPVNPGNSGGPAFDSQGNLVGIVSYTVGDMSGLGFLIPCNVISNLIEDRI